HRVRAELRPPFAPKVVRDLGSVDDREHLRQLGGARRDPPVVLAGAEDVVPLTLRSEEHTSELQSRGHLVCRLLLEKKKLTLEKLAELGCKRRGAVFAAQGARASGERVAGCAQGGRWAVEQGSTRDIVRDGVVSVRV